MVSVAGFLISWKILPFCLYLAQSGMSTINRHFATLTVFIVYVGDRKGAYRVQRLGYNKHLSTEHRPNDGSFPRFETRTLQLVLLAVVGRRVLQKVWRFQQGSAIVQSADFM